MASFDKPGPVSGRGGSVAELLGRRTWNPKVTSSGSVLTTKLELFLGRPYSSTPWPRLKIANWSASCQLVFNHVMFLWIIYFIISSLALKSPIGRVANQLLSFLCGLPDFGYLI